MELKMSSWDYLLSMQNHLEGYIAANTPGIKGVYAQIPVA